MSINSNILYFSRHSKIPRALVSSRSELYEKMPHLEGELAVILYDKICNPHSPPRFEGQLLKTSFVGELLVEHWGYQRIDSSFVVSEALIINLPDEFEPVLAQLVIAIPEVKICIEPQLLQHRVCLRWMCHLPGESIATRIHVPYDFLPDIMFDEPFKSENGWISLVMISGNSVAVGGFIASESLIKAADIARFQLRVDSSRTLQSDDSNGERSEAQPLSNLVAESHIDKRYFYVSFFPGHDYRLRGELNKTLQSGGPNSLVSETRLLNDSVAECHSDSNVFNMPFSGNDDLLRDDLNRPLQLDDQNYPRSETRSLSDLAAECDIDSDFVYVSFPDNV